MEKNTAYFLPYLDGDWLGYGPLDPSIDFGLLPPNQAEIHRNLETAVGFMKETVGGKFVFGAHTGTYCREAFYSDQALSFYREFAANGGEIAVHPHEERIKAGHFISDMDHMRFIISWNTQRLTEGGVKPTTLRIPYNGYVAGLTRIAEENDLLVDLSSAPGFFNDAWCADWRGQPYTAHLLDYEKPAKGGSPPEKLSRVLEVPLGCDGKGTNPTGNYLFNETVSLETMQTIWDAIIDRTRKDGPQMIYVLAHLHSMNDDELQDRLRGFLAYAQENNGIPLTPSEAYETHKSL